MAQLKTTPAKGDWTTSSEQWEACRARQERQFQKLQAESDAVVRFPFADGYAYYRVCKDRPLTLERVPIGDAWMVPYSHIRGLRRKDIVALAQHERELKQLFAKRY